MSDFCTNCGSEISSGNNFCAKCGTKAIANNQPKNKSNMGTVTKIIIGIAIIIVLIIVVLVVLAVSIASSFVAEQSQLTSSMPLGEPETKPEEFELTTSQKNRIRAIEVGCDDQIALASLYGEATEIRVSNKCAEHLQNTLAGFENSWMVDQAILNHDPEKCEETTNPTGCIMKYVKETNEPEACELLDTNTSCLSMHAKIMEDPEICLQADNPLSCINGFISEFPDSSTCQILTGQDQIDCIGNYVMKHSKAFNVYSKENEEHCNLINELDGMLPKRSCHLEQRNAGLLSPKQLFSLKTKEGTSFVCGNFKGINEKQWPDYCLALEAIYTNDFSLCDATGFGEPCYVYFALHGDSFSIQQCEELTNGDRECIRAVAARTQNMSICEELNDDICKRKVRIYARWLEENR